MSVVNMAPTEANRNDFWRSNVGADQPNGTADTTEGVWRQGNVGIGNDGSNQVRTPVAVLDVAYGTRSGTDPRVVGTALYVTTNNMPALAHLGAGLVPPAPAVEFRHTNQSVGVGVAYNGLYMTGTNPSNDFILQSKGTGQFTVQQPQLLGPYAYENRAIGVALAAGQGWYRREFAASVQQAGELLIRSAAGSGAGIERFWQQRDHAGAFRNALRLSPSPNNPTFRLSVNPGNIADPFLLNLYGDPNGGDTGMFGLGIQANTLRYSVGAAGRWHMFGGDPNVAPWMRLTSNRFNVLAMPTSSAGLVSGDLWADPADGNRVKRIP